MRKRSYTYMCRLFRLNNQTHEYYCMTHIKSSVLSALIYYMQNAYYTLKTHIYETHTYLYANI